VLCHQLGQDLVLVCTFFFPEPCAVSCGLHRPERRTERVASIPRAAASPGVNTACTSCQFTRASLFSSHCSSPPLPSRWYPWSESAADSRNVRDSVRSCRGPLHSLETQSCRRSLHTHDDATDVIDQIVVVIAKPRRTAFGRVGRVRNPWSRASLAAQRELRLGSPALARLNTRARCVHLSHFRQLFAGNAAMMIRIGLNETAIHRHMFAPHQSDFHTTGDDLLNQLLKQLCSWNRPRFLENVEKCGIS
jgi:hypothetical protein